MNMSFKDILARKDEYIGGIVRREKNLVIDYIGPITDVAIDGEAFIVYSGTDKFSTIMRRSTLLAFKDDAFCFTVPYVGRVYVSKKGKK